MGPQPRTLLTIELVPRTCWFSNVRSELATEDWDRIKKVVYKQARYRCEICGGRGPEWPVEAHEIWDYDDATTTQRLRGLIALCPDCHQVKHYGLAELRGEGAHARAHLGRVNNWSAQDVEYYIEAQYELWAQRSQRQWQLDLGWLERFDIDTKELSSRRRPISS